MNKGIATETILLLLVGIVVVGILVFLVYKYVIGAPLSQEECRGRLITWCTSCSLACTTDVSGEWITCGTNPGTEVTGSSGCAQKYFGFTITSAGKCKDHKTDCNSFIQTT
jgi:hypothetical protein